MKKLFIGIISIFFLLNAGAQDLPKDVERVYKGAEKLKHKKDYDQAIAAYKDVLRSVKHVPSMVSIADIEMILKSRPNYRQAYEYYQMAIDELVRQINIAPKKKDKAKLAQQMQELEPKRNKAKSYTKDFNDAKGRKGNGSRLLEDSDLK